jgi:hypothetical protein
MLGNWLNMIYINAQVKQHILLLGKEDNQDLKLSDSFNNERRIYFKKMIIWRNQLLDLDSLIFKIKNISMARFVII